MNVMRARVLATLLISAAVVAQAPPPRDRAWREDLAFFAREFPARQLDFAKLYPKDRFDSEIDAITRAIPTATDAEIVLSLMRLVASAHVGHTNLRWPEGSLAFHRLPLGLQWYSDGLAITAATEPYREALGLRVSSIGTMTPEQLEAAVAPYLAYEDDGWLHQLSQSAMLMEEILRALGQVETDGRVAITLARPDGTTTTLRVAAVPWADRSRLVTAVEALGIPVGPARIEPLRYYRYEILAGTKTLYIRYNRCADDPRQPFADFAKELLAKVDANPSGVERVVIDLRANGGGNSQVIEPLLTGLHARKSLSAKGRLFALVGPGTFSSGLLAVIKLRHDLNAVVVGEPPGERLNSYGEVRPLTLPNSHLNVQYSTKYFTLVKGGAAYFEPDMVVRTSIADWRAGNDPVLGAALTRR